MRLRHSRRDFQPRNRPGMPHLAAIRRRIPHGAFAVSGSAANSASDPEVMARISPSRFNVTSTANPGTGAASDFQTPSRQNQYCRPSIISRPGPVRGSRRILPRFFMALSGDSGKTERVVRTPLQVLSFCASESHVVVLPPPRWLVVSFRIAQRVRKNRHAVSTFSARPCV